MEHFSRQPHDWVPDGVEAVFRNCKCRKLLNLFTPLCLMGEQRLPLPVIYGIPRCHQRVHHSLLTLGFDCRLLVEAAVTAQRAMHMRWFARRLISAIFLAKYGKEEFGWRTRKANGAFGVGVWKEILKEYTWCWENMGFKVGKGNRIRNVTVEECWDQNTGQGGWILGLLRDLNDWEVGLVGNILAVLRDYSVTVEDDSVCWKKGEDGLFKVKYAYNVLANSQGLDFPHSNVWVGKVPTKIAFFAWEATWGKVLTLDRLQRRGWHLPNRNPGIMKPSLKVKPETEIQDWSDLLEVPEDFKLYTMMYHMYAECEFVFPRGYF
ncbi:hypothetical protein CK203_067047 [Vitis vinifera]|uniref:Reverse transcriptase zinc-binding domain-containing protein n=1 Tax=Vitis vinifera TaxID=29760 RepID=A0A438F5H6_VITVI|nr:hypothetical protein CK203_067047 [Vitis vinifera]